MGKKDKKGRRKDEDDDYWEKAGEKLPSTNGAATGSPADHGDEDEDDVAPATSTSKFSFAALATEDGDAGNDDDDEDGGGLMGAISAAAKKQANSGGKKDKKKKKKGRDDDFEAAFADDAEGGEQAGEGTPPVEKKGPIEVTADDWLEDDFGDDKKGKKGGKKNKKGGKQQQPKDEDEEEEEEAKAKAKAPAAAAKEQEDKAVDGAEAEEEAADVDEETPNRPLSKKEKEKLKKEKEKAKKKAQAAAKKAALAKEPETTEPADEAADTPAKPTPDPSQPPPPPADADAEGEDDEEGDEAGGGGAADKKKKKKKKKGPDAAAAAAKEKEDAKKKKGAPAALAALRAAMEAQKAAEAEQARREEEERLRIEEEERLKEEEAKKAAEAKEKKKQKEKEKREQLKREGKLLTPKQKAELAAANARKEARLAAGLKVAGLEKKKDGEGAAPAKRMDRKKGSAARKGPQAPVIPVASTSTAQEEEEKPEEPVVEETKDEEVDEAAEVPKEDEDEDDWEKELEEKPAADEPGAKLKDDWEEDSADEAVAKEQPKKKAAEAKAKPEPKEKEKAAPAPPLAKPVNGINGSAKPTVEKPASATAPSKPVAKSGPSAAVAAAKVQQPKEDESSDEESDEDSDEDSDDDSDETSDEDSDEEKISAAQREAQQKKEEAAKRREQRRQEAMAAGSKDNLRSPICCILGHVDTGKTKLLDKIRQTNVQEKEAGGITQQIGATYFPMENIKKKTDVLKGEWLKDYKLPGLLVIDTPGHESFSNLRSRGSSLCNIAVLVVDIMHGLEPQTKESLRLLKEKKIPFIVALNKVDRLYGWKAIPDNGVQDSLQKQAKNTQSEFEKRWKQVFVELSEQGFNPVLYYENKDFGRYLSVVPTSAHTGEGIPDMLMLLVKLSQERMTGKLMYLAELECTVLEVKVIEGHGTTIDVVLSNGILREGDKIIVCGLNGAIVTQVRALLTPQPLKELRVKGAYVHHKEVKAALGVKVVATGLEKAIAGSRLMVVEEDDDEEEMKEEIMGDLTSLYDAVDKDRKGVWVQASTLGSLEALLEFLRTSKIPVGGINIGPVHKKDVTRAAAMTERAPEYAVMLCFDVEVEKEAEQMAEEMGLKVFKAEIIYHLFDKFTKYYSDMMEAKKKDSAPKAVWPCRLKILKCFAKRDPIIVGCDIIQGSLRVGTPLCVVKTDPETKKKSIVSLGKVTSLEINHKPFETVQKSQVGAGVAVKIERAVYEQPRMHGRHFDDNDELVSLISRQSIDVLKTVFRKDVSDEEWQMIIKLKALLDIQ